MLKKATAVITAAVMSLAAFSVSAYADTTHTTRTAYEKVITASDIYLNWDGPTNVSQFIGGNGDFYYAVDEGDSVVVVRTKDGQPLKKRITLKKQHPLFGTVISDNDGNFYLVTGEENTGSNRKKETVFISKYNKNGKHIKTVGDNGRSSLAYYYEDEFNTMVPFRHGTCHAAISNGILAVNYPRKMYSGHQSNSVFCVNINTMSKVSIGAFYNSHSFAQRTVATDKGFLFASEGDSYNRAFTVYSAVMNGNELKSSNEGDIFHFWVEKGTHDKGDMCVLNNNFAHMGGIVSLPDGKAALVATSAKSLNKDAAEESEELFIQIFDTSGKLGSSSAYVTSGTRSGLSGNNGDESVTDYGVKWLTAFNGKVSIKNPQVAALSDGRIVILYERYEYQNNGTGNDDVVIIINNGQNKKSSDKKSKVKSDDPYKGVYYMILDKSGKVIQKSKCFSKTAKLNPCEMPVISGNKVIWAGNNTDRNDNHIYINTLKIG